MQPIQQTVFDDILGDCFRACVASIFEWSIDEMPNFWEQTQDVDEYWELTDEWFMQYKGFKCLHVVLSAEHMSVVRDLLCIACAKSPRSSVDHAVVWFNGMVHDPHPSGAGLAEEPDWFTLFVPIDPRRTPK
uniref:Uncharacterized protein n=1 Tax=viral metagenome TaxID=1070528 RepID=A0A6M3K716_9ZZZZ